MYVCADYIYVYSILLIANKNKRKYKRKIIENTVKIKKSLKYDSRVFNKCFYIKNSYNDYISS